MDGRGDELRRFDLLQHGLDLIDQGITVLDGELRLVAWNKRFFTMLDFPDTLARVGTPFVDFIRYNARRGEYGPGDVEEQVRRRLEAASAQRPHHFERVRPGTGQIIAVRGEPLPAGGFVTVYTDITEQHYYEMMIRERNDELDRRVRERTQALEAANDERDAIAQRLALITDTVPALMAYIDRDQRYRFANRRYAEWFGHTKASIVGLTVAEVLGEELFANIGPQCLLALGGREVSYEYAMSRGDGATAFARSTLVPEIGRDGQVVGLFVLSVDVTDQKRAEAALMQAQKMEAVGQLTGGLAHDFNNLLTIVVGNLAGLHDRLAGTADGEELLEPALGAARRGVELTRRLLTFSRRQPLEPTAVEVGRLVGEVLHMLRRSLPEAIEIVTQLPDPPLHALADPHQLENALLNLVINARDAMPDGGRLTIAILPVTVAADEAGEIGPGDYVGVAVGDTGIGMDEATLSKAFEPFFTSKEFGSGSGLGLSMAYGFARQSGGGIRIRSARDAGTTVTVLLPWVAAPPLAEAPRAEAQSVDPPPPAEVAGRLVLLVEDDREVRRVIRRQLRELGFAVVEAGDGHEAMRLVESLAEIAVVLTDVVMPRGMGGLALAEAAAACRPDLPIVLMSGYPAGEPGPHPPPPPYTPSSGAPILVKPFSRAQLAAAIGGRKP